MISVGYMDPGNWTTDIEAGSKYGFELLSLVLISSLAAILLQILSLRLGIATSRDLTQMSRENFRPKINFALWIFAEISIVSCDLSAWLIFIVIMLANLWLVFQII